MKKLKIELQGVSKSLKQLTRKTEQLTKKLDKLEKAKAVKVKAKPRVKPPKKAVAKKAVKATAIDTIFDIIKKSRKGIDTKTLKKKTGFVGWKLHDNIHRLKKQGKIKTMERGIYIKA